LFTPTLAVYFKTTTTTRNLNYFVKRNILWNSFWLGTVFLVLVLHLNIKPEVEEGGWLGKMNHCKKNTLLGCQEQPITKKNNRTMHEFSFYNMEESFRWD
jgi:hypothetical protein